MSVGANGLVNAGYRGIATIAGNQVRFSDSSITAKQEIEAPDLVMGDWDRDAYTYGKIEVGGSISGPVTETFLSGAGGIIEWACGRTSPCGELTAQDIELYYFCGSNRTFSNLFVNSFSFSVAAGEVAQFSADVIGTGTNPFGTSNPPNFTDAEKLLTWDKVNVNIIGGGDAGEPAVLTGLGFQNFEFSVNNNVETVYGLGQPDLFPFDIVPGIRQISGTLTVYNTPDFNGADDFEQYCAGNESVLEFGLESLCAGAGSTVQLRCRFHRVEPTLNTGTITSTVGFTGVSHQSGFPWDI